MSGAAAIALGVWWTSNTVAHHFIHRPFFRRNMANRAFAAGMSVAIGIPQALWRERHLAHHAGVAPRVRISRELMLEATLVVALWTAMAANAPQFFAFSYVPGYVAGLLLCALHGHFEHARGTTSYYGRLYNLLLFNDGYHVEHHANPAVPWSRLPESRDPTARTSAWPAPLRWLERRTGKQPQRRQRSQRRQAPQIRQKLRRSAFSARSAVVTISAIAVQQVLDALERLVLHSPRLQRFVLRTHARAFRHLLPMLPQVARVAVVGGGLFPRTALILRSLLPNAHVRVIDASRDNLTRARERIDVEFVQRRYAPGDPADVDLLVIPLAFDGERAAIYERPPARAVIVHDWIWHRRGESCVISIALLKRLNLVRQ
jgi:hypothetical protein